VNIACNADHKGQLLIRQRLAPRCTAARLIVRMCTSCSMDVDSLSCMFANAKRSCLQTHETHWGSQRLHVKLINQRASATAVSRSAATQLQKQPRVAFPTDGFSLINCDTLFLCSNEGKTLGTQTVVVHRPHDGWIIDRRMVNRRVDDGWMVGEAKDGYMNGRMVVNGWIINRWMVA